jgi:hypothetical protein
MARFYDTRAARRESGCESRKGSGGRVQDLDTLASFRGELCGVKSIILGGESPHVFRNLCDCVGGRAQPPAMLLNG